MKGSKVGSELQNARSLILLAKVSGSDVLMLSAPLRVPVGAARSRTNSAYSIHFYGCEEFQVLVQLPMVVIACSLA